MLIEAMKADPDFGSMAGMGNLSEAAAKDFAKELKAYLDIYGLDGIHRTPVELYRRTDAVSARTKHNH